MNEKYIFNCILNLNPESSKQIFDKLFLVRRGLFCFLYTAPQRIIGITVRYPRSILHSSQPTDRSKTELDEECFCGIKADFSAKMNCCTLFNCFFNYDVWHGQNRQVMSCCAYVAYCERFELKLGMRGEEGLLTNFPKLHGDRATSTMFSQHCHNTYRQTSQ